MSRARPALPAGRGAAARQIEGGCSSAFLLPPLAVLVVGCLLGAFAGRLDPPARAAGMPSAAPAGGIASIFTPEIQHWAAALVRWSAGAGLDPDLAATVMQIESCGDPRARSRAGAMGLFQVMPYHFAAAEAPYDPDTNARRGLDYLKRALQAAGGDPRLALAGYNGGIGIIARGEQAWPAETQRYVRYGAPIYEDARQGSPYSPALAEWHARYGASLCRQAAQRLGIP